MLSILDICDNSVSVEIKMFIWKGFVVILSIMSDIHPKVTPISIILSIYPGLEFQCHRIMI